MAISRPTCRLAHHPSLVRADRFPASKRSAFPLCPRRYLSRTRMHVSCTRTDASSVRKEKSERCPVLLPAQRLSHRYRIGTRREIEYSRPGVRAITTHITGCICKQVSEPDVVTGDAACERPGIEKNLCATLPLSGEAHYSSALSAALLERVMDRWSVQSKSDGSCQRGEKAEEADTLCGRQCVCRAYCLPVRQGRHASENVREPARVRACRESAGV